jgi:hypothetical protein
MGHIESEGSTMKRTTPTHDLAEQINAEHAAATADAQSAIEHAIACGKLLLKAKSQTASGQWVSWLEHNTKLSVRQSQRYMSVAKNDNMSQLVIDGMRLLEPPQPEVPSLEKLEQRLVKLDVQREVLLKKIAEFKRV